MGAHHKTETGIQKSLTIVFFFFYVRVNISCGKNSQIINESEVVEHIGENATESIVIQKPVNKQKTQSNN